MKTLNFLMCSDNFKIYTDWTQEWTSLKQFQKNKYLDVHEVVRGPFSSPRLIKTRPIIVFSTCQQEARKIKDCRNVRRGIPDTWNEYLVFKKFYDSPEAGIFRKNLIPSCVRYFATEGLWNKTGLPFIQGIPDPWKSTTLEYSQPRFSRAKIVYPKRAACIYDGDDEAEIECNEQCQSNKDHINNKKHPSREVHCKLNCPLTERRVFQTFEGNSNVVKKRGTKVVNNLSSDKKSKLISSKRKHRVKIKNDYHTQVELIKTIPNDQESFSNKCVRNHTHNKCIRNKSVQPNDKQHFPSKVCTNREKIQTNVKKKVRNISIGTINPKTTTAQVNTSFKNRPNVNARMFSNNMCCNCLLKNYIISNTKCFPEFANSMKDVDLFNRVLCQDCENIFYKRRPRELISKGKSLEYCTPGPGKYAMQKKICDWTKLKLCACMKRVKKEFGVRYKLGHCKSSIASKQELKLMCYHCNSPYLKVVNINASTSCRKTHSYVCKKPSSKLKNVRNKTRDCVVKRAITRRQRNFLRSSKKYCCTCTGNKKHISKRDLGMDLMIAKRKNDAIKDHEFFQESYCNKMLQTDTQKIMVDEGIRNSVELFNTVDDKVIVVTERPENLFQCNRLCVDNMKKGRERERQVSDERCFNITQNNKEKNRENKVMFISNKGTEAAQFQHSKSDKTLWYAVSDSGEYADVSDNVTNVGFNVMAQDRLSVTSITFIRRLNNAIPIRRLYHRKAARKPCYICRKPSVQIPLDFKQALDVENRIVCKRRNN